MVCSPPNPSTQSDESRPAFQSAFCGLVAISVASCYGFANATGACTHNWEPQHNVLTYPSPKAAIQTVEKLNKEKGAPSKRSPLPPFQSIQSCD